MKIEWINPLQARPTVQSLEVPEGIRVREVLERVGWREPEGEDGSWGIGVFGREVDGDYRLSEGDRLELCPPLAQSPMEARRQRAVAQKSRKSAS